MGYPEIHCSRNKGPQFGQRKATSFFCKYRWNWIEEPRGEPLIIWLAIPGCLKQVGEVGVTVPAEMSTHAHPSPSWGGVANIPSLWSGTGAILHTVFHALHPIPSYCLWQPCAPSRLVSVLRGVTWWGSNKTGCVPEHTEQGDVMGNIHRNCISTSESNFRKSCEN